MRGGYCQWQIVVRIQMEASSSLVMQSSRISMDCTLCLAKWSMGLRFLISWKRYYAKSSVPSLQSWCIIDSAWVCLITVRVLMSLCCWSIHFIWVSPILSVDCCYMVSVDDLTFIFRENIYWFVGWVQYLIQADHIICRFSFEFSFINWCLNICRLKLEQGIVLLQRSGLIEWLYMLILLLVSLDVLTGWRWLICKQANSRSYMFEQWEERYSECCHH